MTERPIDLSTLPSYQAPKRSVFSLRKFALMASVVAGLGASVYGFSPSHGPIDIFTSTAHAQVNNEVRKVAQPVGFADIVERVKPSVISVKVAMDDKTASEGRQRRQGRFAVPAGLADGALLPPLRRSRWPASGPEGWSARRPWSGDRPGLRLLHLG